MHTAQTPARVFCASFSQKRLFLALFFYSNALIVSFGVCFLSERILPLAAVDRLIRKGSSMRVSEDAAIELTSILEEHGVNLSKLAGEFAKHAKRKTVTGQDIKLAAKGAAVQK